jgi:nickel/cobalt transporter (NiCoT) family protein
MSAVAAAAPSLVLIFALGLRHGLDPDHIAVIDNMTLRAIELELPSAPLTGMWFAVGHSLSVAVVALSVAAFASTLVWPEAVVVGIDWLVVGLLVLVGGLNLRALRRPNDYKPSGWRQHLVPKALQRSSHPLAVVAVGAMFGLVFDTATQAAAWGAAAGAGGGLAAAGAIALAFAAGMILTDSADSLIVTRLLRGRGDQATLRRYRRGVGWLVVILSFGMAGYTAVALVWPEVSLGDDMATWLGVSMVVTVAATTLLAFRQQQRHRHRVAAND